MAGGRLPPGFRFHPTDVELLQYYLKRKILGKKLNYEAISEVDMYKFAPWDLPAKACLRSRDLEWYFFCTRDRRYGSGRRVNRTAEVGYWKTTGKDRLVYYDSRVVGMKKTLIFHLGRAPHGERTDWVVHEYKLEDKVLADAGVDQGSFVLCKLFQKSGLGPQNGAQYGAPFIEEEWDDDDTEIDSQLPSAGSHHNQLSGIDGPSQHIGGSQAGNESIQVEDPIDILLNNILCDDITSPNPQMPVVSGQEWMTSFGNLAPCNTLENLDSENPRLTEIGNGSFSPNELERMLLRYDCDRDSYYQETDCLGEPYLELNDLWGPLDSGHLQLDISSNPNLPDFGCHPDSCWKL